MPICLQFGLAKTVYNKSLLILTNKHNLIVAKVMWEKCTQFLFSSTDRFFLLLLFLLFSSMFINDHSLIIVENCSKSNLYFLVVERFFFLSVLLGWTSEKRISMMTYEEYKENIYKNVFLGI